MKTHTHIKIDLLITINNITILHIFMLYSKGVHREVGDGPSALFRLSSEGWRGYRRDLL
jgi:hypothetical protein